MDITKKSLIKNNYLRIPLLLTFLLSLLIVPSFSLAQSYTSPDIKVTLLSQSPDPVEPGQVVKVKFKIENQGKESAVDNIVKILPKYPFSLYGDVDEKNIGKLRTEQTGADAVIVEFNLKVDENAVEEDTEIELMVKVGANVWKSYTQDEFLVDIQTHDAVLDIASINSDPQQITPGQTAKIEIMVKNLADSLLKDIKFKLDFGDENIPLAPYQSSSEKRIPQIQTSQSNSLTFQVMADPNAASGLYKIPLTITYNDEKGNDYTISDFLTVIIGEKPKVRAYIKKSSVLQTNKEGEITLEIANAGTTNVKFLELYLLPSPDYHLVSTSNYFYIGDLDSDDTETIETTIFINKNIDLLRLPLQIKYYDANNKPYQQQFNLTMALYSPSQLKKFGITESSYLWLYMLIIVIIVVAYFFYHKYYKKKKQ